MSGKDISPTHVAYTLKQSSKQASRWIELGSARVDDNGSIHVHLDVLPIGGFNGYIHCVPAGRKPPTIDPVVRRPASGGGVIEDGEV